MIINGSERLAVEWSFEGFLIIAQGNQSIKLTPRQAEALIKFVVANIGFQLKHDGTITTGEA